MFASLHAFDPRVISVRVVAGPTIFEPSATGSATTKFAGCLDCSAFGAYGSDFRRRHCWCLYVNTSKINRETTSALYTFLSTPYT